MNRINNFTYISSLSTKNDGNCAFNGKTLNLRNSKVALVKKSAKSRKLKRTMQQNFGIKNDESLECQSYRFNELSRPKLKRVNSVLEKQRQKSKFDMIKAEKFVKIFENSVTSRSTPGDVRKCIVDRKKLAEINKKINYDVDEFCKKIKTCKYAQISFNDYNKIKTRDILKKLAFNNTDDKLSKSSRAQRNERPTQRKCISVDDYVLMREKGAGLVDKIKKPNVNDDENEISDTLSTSLSNEAEFKTDENSEQSLISKELSFTQQFSENKALQSTMIIASSDEKISLHESLVMQENYLKLFDEPLNEKSTNSTHQSSSKKKSEITQLRKLSHNQTELSRKPSFAKNFPIKRNTKVIENHQENRPLEISNIPSEQQHMIKTSSQNLQTNEKTVSVLDQDKLRVRSTDQNDSSGSTLSTSNGFEMFVNSQKSQSTTIALREFIEDDLKINNDLDFFVRVSKPNFDKVYIVRKLEDSESLKEFCRSDISKRSKLFKLKETQSSEEVHVRKLPMENLKSFCGVKHKSDLVELELSSPFIADQETFTIQRLNQDKDVVFSKFLAMDISVVKSSSSISKFKVLKK